MPCCSLFPSKIQNQLNMSSPHILSNSFKLGELVPPLHSNPHTPHGSASPSSHYYNSNVKNNNHNFSYSFINEDFIDTDQETNLNPASISAFRNLTSTPKSSHPTSLPKSLPIDWKLFNKQFTLNQKLRQSKLKRKRAELGLDEFDSEPKVQNNFENLPFQVIDFIADCVDSQNDLINLSQSCKFFNKIINKRLYSKVIIVDSIMNKQKNYDSSYTLLDVNNYPKFLATLHSNEVIVQLIKEIIIDTSSNNTSYDQLNDNIYESLYELFLTKNNNLKILENLDLNNLKKFDSLIQYNRGYLIKHNHNKYNYYVSSADNLDEIIKKDLLNLQNFQLLDLNDINKLPNSAQTISIFIEHHYNFKEPFKLTTNGWKILTNITSLQLCTSTTFDSFVQELYSMYNLSSTRFPKLSNIKSLSISKVHKISDDHDEMISNELNFEKLNTIIDLSKVEELELKVKCFENVLCNCCIIKFFHDWYETLLINDESKLRKLSIINHSPSGNANVNIQWDHILTNLKFLQKFGQNLEFFFINLNDFPFIPLFEKTNALETNDSMKLPINDGILQIRKTMYMSMLKSFKNLEILIIPDFFYNWLVYNNIHDLSNDENLNYLNYLDSCHCVSCCEARLLFKSYSNTTAFKDFKGRFNSHLNYNKDYITGHNGVNGSMGNNNYNKLDDHPDTYRIFYNFLIRELKSKIPWKQLNKIQNSLNVGKFPPNSINDSIVPSDDFNKLIKLIIHSLRHEIQIILNHLPNIKKFNLGGILFKVYKQSDGKAMVHAVYDDYNEVYKVYPAWSN